MVLWDTVRIRETVWDTVVWVPPPETVRVVEVHAETLLVRDTVVAEIPDSVLRWLDEPRCYAFSRRWTDFPHAYFLVAERPPRAYFSEGDTVHVWEGYEMLQNKNSGPQSGGAWHAHKGETVPGMITQT